MHFPLLYFAAARVRRAGLVVKCATQGPTGDMQCLLVSSILWNLVHLSVSVCVSEDGKRVLDTDPNTSYNL